MHNMTDVTRQSYHSNDWPAWECKKQKQKTQQEQVLAKPQKSCILEHPPPQKKKKSETISFRQYSAFFYRKYIGLIKSFFYENNFCLITYLSIVVMR